MPTPIDDDDDDAADVSPKGLQRRLNKVNEILVRANTRLDRIRAGFADPPIPDRPAMLATLQQIKEQAAHSNKVADEMIAILRR